MSAKNLKVEEAEGVVKGVLWLLQNAKETTKTLQNKEKRLEAELLKKDKELKSKMAEITELIEDKDKLSKQLSSGIGNVKSDGSKPSVSMTSSSKNERNEVDKKKTSNTFIHSRNDVQVLNDKLLILANENDILNKEKESIAEAMKKEKYQYKKQLQTVNDELKLQRTKNDELRTKNWKVMEALNNVERLYQKLSRTQSSSKQQPSSTKTNSSFPVSEAMTKDTKDQITVVKNKDNTGTTDDTKDQLKTQVENYKLVVLTETEKIFRLLESNLQTEETRRKDQLSEKEAELGRYKTKLEAISKTNIALEETLSSVNSAKSGMEAKTQELQKKLADEEAKRIEITDLFSKTSEKQSDDVRALNDKLLILSNEKNILTKEKESIVDAMKTEIDRYKEQLKRIDGEIKLLRDQNDQKEASSLEIKSLRKNLQTEKGGREDLENKVLQLNRIIAAAQDALQQEQKTVQLLRFQMSKLEKISQSPTVMSTNGPSAPGKVDEPVDHIEDTKSKNTNSTETGSDDNKTPTLAVCDPLTVSQAAPEGISLDLSEECVSFSSNAVPIQPQPRTNKNQKPKKKKKNKHVF